MRKKHMTKRTRRKGGSKILNFLKRVNSKLRSSKLLSRLGSAYSTTGLPYSAQVAAATNIAKKLGYGRKCPKYCRRRGGALKLAGSGMGYRGRI